ncbi:hypothetical protein UPYG_G00255760 [Umbra pygmaea]|uniref:SAM domain-containing protein n=1 Tax=Umbra pygmaea TaxID=75934 RepID=A0ABD0WVJ5_UMBPY
MAFLDWSCQDVAKWIKSLGYPHYTACFTENLITGKKLIYVNCRYLPRLGITDFEDMKTLLLLLTSANLSYRYLKINGNHGHLCPCP